MSRRKRVQQAMQDINITSAQVSKLVALSVDVFNKWVDGLVEIPYKYVLEVSEILNIDPEDLVEIA